MQRTSASRATVPSRNAFRAVLVRPRTTAQAITPEAEVQMLRAELATVRRELSDLYWATNAFVRTLI